MAESPPFNQVYYTSISPDELLTQLAMIQPGWTARSGGLWTIVWTRKYTSTLVLVVGIALLLMTLIGGLLLLVRSEESLVGNIVIEQGRTKLILTGVADQYLASALFSTLGSLPQA